MNADPYLPSIASVEENLAKHSFTDFGKGKGSDRKSTLFTFGDSEMIANTGDLSFSVAIRIEGKMTFFRIMDHWLIENLDPCRRRMALRTITLPRCTIQPTPSAVLECEDVIPMTKPSRSGLHNTISSASLPSSPSYVYPNDVGSLVYRFEEKKYLDNIAKKKIGPQI